MVTRNPVALIVSTVVWVTPFFANGQINSTERTVVTFEEIYDEPYDINKFFIGFQPLYADVFASNVNAGFGVDVSYYHNNLFDLHTNYRRTYSTRFFDFNRYLSNQNSHVDNAASSFNYVELGGTYHIKDFDADSETKMVLYRDSLEGRPWAAQVPLKASVPSRLRKIYGARLGGIYWNSTINLNRVLEAQGLSHVDLVNEEQTSLPSEFTGNGTTEELNVFTNIRSAGLFVGGSLTLIRNVAVSFDEYDEGLDDSMLTLFLDVLYAPSLKMDPVSYADNEYSTKVLELVPVGARLGLDGKFNRTLSWGYGGEIGYRPSVKGGTFFALFKISFPLYGSDLNYEVESFEQ